MTQPRLTRDDLARMFDVPAAYVPPPPLIDCDDNDDWEPGDPLIDQYGGGQTQRPMFQLIDDGADLWSWQAVTGYCDHCLVYESGRLDCWICGRSTDRRHGHGAPT